MHLTTLQGGVHLMIEYPIWLQCFWLSSHCCLCFHKPPHDNCDRCDDSEGNCVSGCSGDDNYDRNSDNGDIGDDSHGGHSGDDNDDHDNADCNNHQDENSDDVEV